jgi:uncharacterized protein
MQVSSMHITFNTEDEWKMAGEQGWMQQIDLQYHWENEGYSTFDDFLAALKYNKRKGIKAERKSIASQGLTVRRLFGDDITPDIWDKFYGFYMATCGKLFLLWQMLLVLVAVAYAHSYRLIRAKVMHHSRSMVLGI